MIIVIGILVGTLWYGRRRFYEILGQSSKQPEVQPSTSSGKDDVEVAKRAKERKKAPEVVIKSHPPIPKAKKGETV